MKIAIIINTTHSVTKNTGFGVENFTYQLVDGLLEKNHDITLFASGDSLVPCNLISVNNINLHNDKTIPKEFYSYYEDALFIEVIKKANNGEYDLIHSQDHNRGLLFSHLSNKPFISTFHDVFDTARSPFNLIKKFNIKNTKHILISISKYQQKTLLDNGFENVKNIYNGINTSTIPTEKNYERNNIIFFGRLNSRKGPQEAVRVSLELKKELKIYGYINNTSKEEIELKETIIKMIGENTLVQFIDPVYGLDKWNAFSQAKLFLFPVQWEEAFGLVMAESMACGTPVVAFARGSVPENVLDGETGFIVNPSGEDIRGDWIIKKTGIEGLEEAINRIYSMPTEDYKKMRLKCRAHIEKNFTVERMVNDYEKTYQEVIDKNKK